MAEPTSAHEVERWFHHRGMTALLAGTGSRTRVAVRVVPVLVGLYVVVMIVVVPDGNNAALTLVGTGTLLLTWIAGSLIRHRRLFAPVQYIGWLEALVFVLVPTATALVVSVDDKAFSVLQEDPISAFELRVVFAALVLVLQLSLLVGVYGVAVLGLASAIASITRELFTSLGESGTVLARTLPFLLGVITFIYFNGDIWRSIGRVPMLGYVGALGLLVIVSGAFLLRREHLDLERLAHFASPGELREAVAEVPLPARTVSRAEHLEYPVDCPLTGHQKGTIRATAALSRLVVASLAGTLVSGFFLLLGFFAITPQVVGTWVSAKPHLLLRISWAGITVEHVRVAFFLGVFAGLYYAVVSATDPALRHGISEHTADDVRQACGARVLLLDEAGQAADQHR